MKRNWRACAPLSCRALLCILFFVDGAAHFVDRRRKVAESFFDLGGEEFNRAHPSHGIARSEVFDLGGNAIQCGGDLLAPLVVNPS